METPNMLAFIEKNQVNKVVFGERLTRDHKPVYNASDLDQSDRVLYKLDDGTEFILNSQDINSAPSFSPDWSL